MNQMERFQRLPPVDLQEMIGLWEGRGIPSGHPLDGVLENLGWFGKRFSAEMRADALLFRAGQKRLIPIDPAWVPLRFALRVHRLGRTQVSSHLFSYLLPWMRARGSVASLKSQPFQGVMSAAMIYDRQPIVDHFRKIDDGIIMGAMVVNGDDRVYFFELERVEQV
ncbi:DUF4334 domain-containing protein [Rhizobium sp. CG4]|uniref:DUF4334 domain-containing protein n=1 Tax=Rhizobium sp. CG4 TaxID=2726075 RepID=UPI002033FC17|nr:DUF4334 domain-containing protein [Rhizobium sp. CG4]MCM2457588.1 DUF4334 domain-containing protein [Rhizobium sp. CG4]